MYNIRLAPTKRQTKTSWSWLHTEMDIWVAARHSGGAWDIKDAAPGTRWDVRRGCTAPGVVGACGVASPDAAEAALGSSALSSWDGVVAFPAARLPLGPPPCSDSITSVGPLSWHTTKRGDWGPETSCSFAVFLCTARFVLPPDKSTHFAAELHFSNLLLFLSVFQFSPCRTPPQPSHLEYLPASTPAVPADQARPFTSSCSTSALHLPPASPPSFVLLALITAGLSEGLFRLFSPLPLKVQVSLSVRWRALAETGGGLAQNWMGLSFLRKKGINKLKETT